MPCESGRRVGTQRGDLALEPLLLDDRILWESDYPHPDSKYPYSSEHFLAMPKVSDESKRKILWDNAIDFYQFPASYLPTEFHEATATSRVDAS